MRDGLARTRLGIALVTFAAYAVALIGPFQFDDNGVIVRHGPVHSLGEWWAAGGSGIRPLLKLSYALCWTLGGGSAVVFHAFNIAVHLLNVELVMRLYSAARDPERRWPFTPPGAGATAVGLLFALHPLQTEAVTYISGRSSSLSACFSLMALLAYATAARSSKPYLGLGVGLLAFACATLTKESAATLPLVLLLWEVCIERPRLGALLKRQAAFWLPAFALFMAALMRQSYFNLLYQSTGTRPLQDAIGYQAEGALYLLSRLVLVHRMSIDPGLGQQPPSASIVAAGGAAVTALIGIAIANVRARPVVAFGIALFVVQIFFPYVILQRTDVINERHAYLGNLGIFAACAVLSEELTDKGARYLAAPLLAALFIATVYRNAEYRSRIALWESTARVSPANPRAHNNLGVAYEADGRYVEARAALERALVLEPEYASARRNLERVQRIQSVAK